MALAGLLAIPVCAMAQTLPCMPPANTTTNIDGPWDQPGLYPAGNVQDVGYYSPSQGANDHVCVYTPPGYTTSKKYPVVYAYPGIGADQGSIFADWCVWANLVADNLIGQGKIQPVIIVAIDDNNGDVQGDTLNVIIPMIEANYSTIADADHRGLYGYSWGGGYTFDIGCSQLDTFHHLSPSSAAPNKSADTDLFPNGGANAKAKLKTLLISCGDADWLGLYPASQNCHNYCDANGIPNYWLSVPGGNHDAGTWRPAIWNFLQLAFPIPKGDGVTFYADYNYGGSASQALGVGSYTISQLAAKGMPNDWASSVKVPSGYTLKMYADDNFTGTCWTLTADQSNFGSIGANDQVSSVKVESNITGTKKIIARHSGKAIDAYNQGTGNGTKIIQWPYWGGAGQQWTVTDTGSSQYKIIGVQSGKAIDINNWDTSNGAKVQLWDYNGGTNQKFNITATDGGYYRITPTHATGSCLDVYYASTSDGADVLLCQWNGGANQQWAFQAP